MRVYHFLNKEYGLKDLTERRLKISRILELNDPFEFLGADLSSRDFRAAMKVTKKRLSKNKGVLCFSKTWTSPVQWTHYSDRHKGVCLGFDVPSKILTKVNYVEERLSHNGAINIELMTKLLTTKFSHWSYEKEYRGFLSLTDEEEGIFYASFSDSLKLRQVIIGAYSNVTRAEISEALRDISNDVEIFKARAAFRSFKIVRNKNEDLWV